MKHVHKKREPGTQDNPEGYTYNLTLYLFAAARPRPADLGPCDLRNFPFHASGHLFLMKSCLDMLRWAFAVPGVATEGSWRRVWRHE